jgi:hypothetical protein
MFYFRYAAHQILARRTYPTTDLVLRQILNENPEFPIQAKTTLWRWMKKLGFSYKRTSKIIVPLDAPSFMAARSRYFRALDQFRNNRANIFWHDETWCNKNEEKTFIWTDGTTGKGRLRQTDGKGKLIALDKHKRYFLLTGKRVVISALLSENGFHLPSVDIFQCDQDHSMDSTHFSSWIDETSKKLRYELGKAY